MYYLILLIILVGAIIEINSRKKNKELFKVSFSILFCMSIFRYGQGTDYFNYEYLYNYANIITNKSFLGILLFPDIGYGIINYIFILLKCPYELFMSIFTTCTMLMYYSFLKKTCNYSMTALLIFYAVIFMIYPTSASRQGFTIAFFLCYMYPLLGKNEYKSYYLLLLFISSIHASSIILGFLPIVSKLKLTTKSLLFIFCISLVLMFSHLNIFSFIPISFIQERMKTYLDSSGNQLLAKIVRFLLIFPLLFIPNAIIKNNSKIERNRKYLIFGYFIYGLTSFSELASSRLWGYFLGFECILLSKLAINLYKFKHKQLILIYYILIACVLWIKDINGIIKQGKYENCSSISYPYISIFEGDKTLNYYRKDKGEIERSNI